MVGLSVGISNQSLSFVANALISVCNASGAWLASFGGGALGKSLPPHLPPLLSAIAFGVLALKEFWEFWQTVQRKKNLLLSKKKETADANNVNDTTTSYDGEKSLNMSRAIHLAIPMTLNNLAGGVAGKCRLLEWQLGDSITLTMTMIFLNKVCQLFYGESLRQVERSEYPLCKRAFMDSWHHFLPWLQVIGSDNTFIGYQIQNQKVESGKYPANILFSWIHLLRVGACWEFSLLCHCMRYFYE